MKNDLLIGGISGALSRTFTAPLELNKIQRQNKFMKNTNILSVLQKEGLRSLWKGNGTNVIRIFPQMSLNYSIFNYLQNNFNLQNLVRNYKNKIPFLNNFNINQDHFNFICGGISGSIAITAVYPLETIRTRLSLQTNKDHYKGIVDVIKKTKIKQLYGGLKMSLFGFSPYNAFNFMFYYKYKTFFNQYNINSHLNYLFAGGLSGISAISITYPTDLIRRRLQLQGMNRFVPKYTGILDVVTKIYCKEGIGGFYRGLLPCYLKIFPSLAIQFYTIEILQNLF